MPGGGRIVPSLPPPHGECLRGARDILAIQLEPGPSGRHVLYGGLGVGFLFQGAERLEASDVASLLQGRGQTRQPPFWQIFLDSGPKVVAVEYPLEPDPAPCGYELYQQTITLLEVNVSLVCPICDDPKLVDSGFHTDGPLIVLARRGRDERLPANHRAVG